MNSGGGNPGPGLLSLLLIVQPDPDVDTEGCERLTRQLRAELAELDVESVGLAGGEAAPLGAKGVDAVTIGALVVALSASGGVFTAVIDTVKDWLGRHAGRHRISVTIDGDTLHLEKASADQRQDLVDVFVRRHTAGS